MSLKVDNNSHKKFIDFDNQLKNVAKNRVIRLYSRLNLNYIGPTLFTYTDSLYIHFLLYTSTYAKL